METLQGEGMRKKEPCYIFLCISIIVSMFLLFGCNLLGLSKYNLYINVEGAGTVSVSPENEYYSHNTRVTLEAIPDEGNRLKRWDGDISGEKNNRIDLAITSDLKIVAEFEELPEYTLNGEWKSFYENNQFSSVSSAANTFEAIKYDGRKQTGKTNYTEVPEAIIVRYNDDIIKTRELDSKMSYFGKEITKIDKPEFKFSRILLDNTRAHSSEEIIQYYNSLPEVKYAERDYVVSVHTATPSNDPLYSYQWNFNQLNMPSAWSIATGVSSVTVAVIDTGIAENISDFEWTNFRNGWNFVSDNADTYDDHGHGTHVAGTIAQTTNNNHGAAGMAYGVSLMPIKVLADSGYGRTLDVALGVIWASDNGADVINLSLGGGSFNKTLYVALKYAYEQKGVTIVASSGNDGASSISYPAGYEEFVIAVGATDNNKQKTSFSNYGPKLDVVAPGVNILQQSEKHGKSGFYSLNGTSMASPHVSALAALLLSSNQDLSQSELYSAITDTAEDLGTPGRNDYYGYGLINPLKALESITPGINAYDISDSVSVLFDHTEVITDEWSFQANRGVIHLSLASESTDISYLDMTLYDNDGTLVESTAGTREKEIVYDVGDNGGLFSVRVHTRDY